MSFLTNRKSPMFNSTFFLVVKKIDFELKLYDKYVISNALLFFRYIIFQKIIYYCYSFNTYREKNIDFCDAKIQQFILHESWPCTLCLSYINSK